MMKLTVVGCSGSLSGPDSPASSYLDCGPGAMGALYRYLDPREIDAIGLSHLHADHCLDLCGYHIAACYSPSAPWPRRPVYAPANAASRLARACEVTGPDGPNSESDESIAERFQWHIWQPNQQIGPFQVRTVRVEHPVEAYAIRVEEAGRRGGVLVYSGDTGPSDALVRLADGADLLLIESAFLDGSDNPSGMHLSGAQAAAVAKVSGARAVVLTHIPPWHKSDDVLAEARPHFDGPISLASPGATWDVGG
jgi:ribonuclease BN (tRNA processing enzyme)